MAKQVEDGQAFVTADEAPVESLDDGVTRQILAHDPHLMVVRVAFPKGAEGYLHQHPHRQASYVEKGSFRVTLDGVEKVLAAGDCYLVAPHLVHGVKALEDSALIDIFSPRRDDFLVP